MPLRLMSLLVPLVLFGWWSVGFADVPTAANIAACNKEAQDAVSKGAGARESASPNTKDHNRAAEARRTEPPTRGTGGGTRSDDPQLAGMDAEGAKDPAYQAAYRTCMRKAGF
jgi:hypothetical protein